MDASDWELFPSPWFELAAGPPTGGISPALLHTPHHDDSTSPMHNGPPAHIISHDYDGLCQPWEAFNLEFPVDVESAPWEILQEEAAPFDCDNHELEVETEVPGVAGAAPIASGTGSSLTVRPAVTGQPVRPVRTRAARRPKIRKENWAAHKERIRTLYIDEDKKLEEVMEIMKDEHDFDAR